MNNDLAERAVACSGWRWIPGMKWVALRDAPLDDIEGRLHSLHRDMKSPYQGAIPDLDDPATLGCLLALVREAYNSEWVHAEAHEFDDDQHNFWCVWAGTQSFEADTEVEALVKALEAAP